MKQPVERLMVSIIKSTTVNPFTKKKAELFNYAFMLAKGRNKNHSFDCVIIEKFLSKEEVESFVDLAGGMKPSPAGKFPFMAPKKFFNEIWSSFDPFYGIRMSNMTRERR